MMSALKINIKGKGKSHTRSERLEVPVREENCPGT